MKIFVYKLLLSCFFLFLLYQLTINYTISEFKQKFYAIDTRENIELVKDKIRDEIKSGLEKDKIFKEEDAILLREFIKKVDAELKDTK